ncbi:MAG: 4Fe-4S binding protein [Lachnospiraceae bacterium]|nr:4Fe-4S binding protein [Lachnospiraceae bacterium]
MEGFALKLTKRRYTQIISAVLYNCNIKGFMEGSIYKGDIKSICTPGLNCYSCPGAVTSCPLGSLQSGLLSSRYKVPYFILGTILLMGIMAGRFICGFLCPFGLLQDLLHKIPSPKIKKNKITRALSYLKYVIFLVFVIMIPLIKYTPGFCKYICPQGTLEGGIPLVIANEPLQKMAGTLFSFKIIIMIIILTLCVFCFRAFCRFVCPLGAIYSLFNPISFFGIKVDEEKCTHCNACIKVCKMDTKKVCDRECIQCGECIKVCKENAIKYGIKK